MYTNIEYYFKKAISYLGFGKYILLHVFVPTFDRLIKKIKMIYRIVLHYEFEIYLC